MRRRPRRDVVVRAASHRAAAGAVGALASVLERDRAQRADERADERRRAYFERLSEDPELAAELVARERPLRKIPVGNFFRRAPEALMESFQMAVPRSFWAEYEGLIHVSCPCGATAHPGEYPHPCDGEERTGCPRWYFYDGREVRVAFSPKGTEPVPVPEDELSGFTPLDEA